VLAGAAVHDRVLWQLVCAVEDAQQKIFGLVLAQRGLEIEARMLLKTKVFRQLSWAPPLEVGKRSRMAARALTDGANAAREELAALAQAKLAFARELLTICEDLELRFFASIILPGAARPSGTGLRKDYTYLFQRYTGFLDGTPDHERGLVIMDELESSQSQTLIDQMRIYFRETKQGRQRVRRIVAEPFFVRSHLTTGIQIADLLACLISWNVRLQPMTAPRRAELDELGGLVLRRQYLQDPNQFPFYGFAVIRDLRPRSERDLDSRIPAGEVAPA
jgi:hypothetical protein